MRKGQRRATLAPLTMKRNRRMLAGMTKEQRLILLWKVVREIGRRKALGASCLKN